jgi:hypothetical protein
MRRAARGVMWAVSCVLLVACAGEEGAGGKDAGRDTGPVMGSVELYCSIREGEEGSCVVATVEATVNGHLFPIPTLGPVPLNVRERAIEKTVITGVLVGPQRLVQVAAYDSRGVQVYAGNTTRDVPDAKGTPMFVGLYRLTANCP